MKITICSEKEVNYDKIGEIVREIVKEELSRQKKPEPLTKEDIQDAVCDGILRADDKKDQMEKDRIKNTKVSVGTKTLIGFHIVGAVVFLACAVFIGFFAENITWITRLNVSMKYLLAASAFGFLSYAEYAVAKNNDRNFVFNVLSILLTFLTLVVSLIQNGG